MHTATKLVAALTLASMAAWEARGEPQPIPPDVIERLVDTPLRQPRNPLPETVQRKVHATLDQLRVDADAGAAAASAATLRGNKSEFDALRIETRRQLALAREQLARSGAQTRLAKLDAFAAQAEERFERVRQALEAIETAPDAARRHAARLKAQAVLRSLQPPAPPLQTGPTPTFEYDTPLLPQPQAPATRLPKYLTQSSPQGPDGYFLKVAGTPLPVAPNAAAECGYTAADLNTSATAQFEVQATSDITGLASSLDYSPTKILKWVYENIAFEPYYGSLKGAQGTLISRAGNATDQASLLIALLRVSNVPARYVKGSIDVFDAAPAGANAAVARWLGTKSYPAAANALAQGRNPAVGLIANASAQQIGVRLVHVWVEACVPYAHYRGARIDTTSHRWVPLDASFKSKTYQAGIGIGTTQFNYSTYLSTRRNGPDSLPHEHYAQNHVEPYIRGLNANNTLKDVPYRGLINPLRLDVLPSSLPYPVSQYLAWAGTASAESSALPDSHRYKLQLVVSNSANAQLATTTLQLPEHILKRITLSPKGATAADQTALDNWRLSGADALPCGTPINVVPLIRSDGAVVVTGSGSVTLCTTNNRLNIQVLLPELAAGDCSSSPASSACINAVTYSNIGAANFHALQAYGFQASDGHLAKRTAKLIASVRATPNPNTNLEETEGEFLNLVGLRYMRYITDATKTVGEFDGGSGDSGNHIGLTSSQMKVTYLFDLPFAVNRTGFLVDVPGGRSRNVDITTGTLVYKTFLLSGYASSAYESYVWQEHSRLDAVSTVRGIQFAREKGIEVLALTSSNWSAAGDTTCANTVSQCYKFTHNANAALNYSVAEVNAIKANYIDQGFTVTIPRSLIEYPDANPGRWKGSIYVAEKNALPASAQAGFIISGGYAGGYTVGPPVSFNYTPTLNTGFVNPPVVPASVNPPSLPPISVGGGAVGNGNSPYNSMSGDPVNMVTGNVYHVERDIAIPGRGGLPIVFERSYNSRAATADAACVPIGCGWTHSFNHYLRFYGVETGAAKVSWVDGTGNEKFFSTTAHVSGNINPNTALANPPGIFVTFRREPSGVYTIREKNGLTYTFANTAGTVAGGQRARLDSIVDRNGNALNLTYSGADLTRVADTVGPSGRGLAFTYTSGRITQITDFNTPTARAFQYTYEADGDLASYKNPLAVSSPTTQPPVTYAYFTAAEGVNLNHALKRYTLPRGNGMRFEYYANARAFRHLTLVCDTDASASTCQITTFTYNDFRREAVQVNQRGFARRFFFDQYGNPLKIVEENGAEHDYTYDAANPYNRLSKTDPLGYRTSYAYDALGNVTTITTPRLATVTFSNFTPYNQPQRIKDTRGNYTVLKYDAKGNVLEEIILRAGATPTIPYTPVAADIQSWSIHTYDTFGNVLTTRRVKDAANPAGQAPVVTYTYDANSLYPVSISRQGDKNGDGVNDAPDTKALVHDTLGRVTTGVDADWHTTTYTYNIVDRVTTGTDALGKQRSFAYDLNGNVTENKLVIGTTTYDKMVYAYDAVDRRTVVTGQGNGTGSAVTTNVYDGVDNPIKVTNPDGFSVRFDYDEVNRVIRAYDEEDNAVTTWRDLDGKNKCTRDPNGNSVFHTYWDKTRDGRPRRTYAPSATACPGPTPASGVRAVEYDWDANGNVIQTTQIGADATTRTTFTVYDALNRPAQQIGPAYNDASLGAIRPVTQFSYNLLGHLVLVQAGYCASATTGCAAATVLTPQMSYVFDDFGRKIRETDANAKFSTFQYDINNNVTRLTDAKAQITDFTWNYGHVLASRTNLSAGNVALAYTPLGLLQTATTRAAGSITVNLVQYTYTYDALNRLNTITDSRGSMVLDYDFSPGGRLNKVKDSHGNETNYLYDALGRFAGIWAPNYGTVAYRYDAGGRLTEKWLPNGVSTRYAWNPDSTLKQVVNRATSSAIISQHDYLYDGHANRRQHIERVGATALTFAYTYDTLNRLLTVKQTTPLDATKDLAYGYDPLNNLKIKTVGTPVTATTVFVHDPANQLLETRADNPSGTLLTAYAYDANGALTKKCEGGTVTRTASDCTTVGGTLSSLGYDTLDRLTQATRGATTESYAYDHEGRRVTKVSAGVARNFLYMGPDIYAEYGTAFTAPAALYTHGPNWDDPILRITGSGPAATAKYYHQDGLGSTVAVSTSTGATESTQRFDAWGNKTAATGVAIATYGYTGREPDASGLIYCRARYYDPSIGRFTQRDPIGYEANDVNLYAYVGNNPVKFSDPEGLLFDVFVDVGFIVYDVGVLAYDAIANGGANWKLHTVALGADVAGALVPFVTGAGAAYRAGNKLIGVAKQADAAVPAGGSAATRGTRVHTKFDSLVESGAASRNVAGERAYVNKRLVDEYRPKGSSNPDAVLGSAKNPTAVYDLKTGQSGISSAQLAKYEHNLPLETPIYTVTPTGHNVPRPQSLAGFGTGLNTGYLTGELYGSTAPYSGSGIDTFYSPRAAK